MLISEITNGILTEAVQQIWGRKAGKVVKKYRCTTGSRKGRIVAQPQTCNAPKKIGSMITMKKVRRMRSPVTQRLAKANKPLSQKRYGKASQRRTRQASGRKQQRSITATGSFRTRSFKPKKVRSKRIK